MRMRLRWRALTPPPAIGRHGSDDARHASVRQLCDRISWRNQSALQRIATIGLIVLWPLAMMAYIPLHVARFGGSVRKTTGKSRFRQAGEQVALILRYRLSPKHYYRFRLYLPELWRQAGHILPRNQIDAIVYPLLRRSVAAKSQPLADKAGFAALCTENSLPHVPVLKTFVRGREAARTGMPGGTLGNGDLFVKPVKGSRGRHTERWRRLSDGRYRSTVGQELDASALLAHVAAISARRPMLVQPALSNHPDLAEISSGALCTMRVVSWRNEVGESEVTNAILRMPVDANSPVDNFHAGGIAAPIDLATGELGRATDIGNNPDIVWHDLHPLTGRRIAGRRIPMWTDVLNLAQRAHRAFDGHIVVGWDIALLKDGPCLVEGNQSPGVGTLQRAAGVPLGGHRFGILMAHHLRPHFTA